MRTKSSLMLVVQHERNLLPLLGGSGVSNLQKRVERTKVTLILAAADGLSSTLPLLAAWLLPSSQTEKATLHICHYAKYSEAEHSCIISAALKEDIIIIRL